MNTLKNIFIKPFKAFKTEELRANKSLAIVLFFALNVTIAILLSLRAGTLSPRTLVLIGVGSVVGFIILVSASKLAHILIRKFGGSADFAEVLSGVLWIDIASTPLRQLAVLFLFRGAQWILIAWTVWLSVLCIRSISGLNTQKSIIVYLLAGLGIILIIALVSFVMGLLIPGAAPLVTPR